MAEKLAYFEEAIEREIKARRLRVQHQAANDLSKKIAAEVEAAQVRVDRQTEEKRQELTREANKKIAAATAREKGEYLTACAAIRSRLVEEVAAELAEFANSDAYEYYLSERIDKVKAALDIGTTKVELCPNGGFVLVSEDGNARADFTFKTRLAEVVYV
jgi:vacuolar-type H+-ATPase subunit E/Vma4